MTEDVSWQAKATATTLHRRAHLLNQVRVWFQSHPALEIDTPLLQGGPNCDPGIAPLNLADPLTEGERWIPTSPEHPLKRAVASGLGDVWALAPVVRQGELGKRHLPEFRCLEWYRCAASLDDLIQETWALIASLLQTDAPVQHCTYREAFLRTVQCDPFHTSVEQLQQLVTCPEQVSVAEALDLVLSQRVQPELGDGAWVITEWPADQAAQAIIQQDVHGNAVAQRFELQWRGIELANGYHECTNANELRTRMNREQQIPKDERFLAAVGHLPDCCGVAVGFDRVVMLACGLDDIAETLAFPFPRA